MFDQYNGRGAVRQSGGSFAEQHAARRGAPSSAGPSFGDLLAPAATTNKSTPPSNNSASPRIGQLMADREQLLRFLNVLFKRCGDQVGKSYVAMRAFRHEPSECVLNNWVPFDGKLVDAATKRASAVANRPFEQRAVFCVIPALFGDKHSPKGGLSGAETNVVAAPAISVELDERPNQSLADLEAVLGKATLVIASGGTWFGPTAIEDKLHAYWRLKAPAVSEDDRVLLKRARIATAALVNADITAPPLCHPMRAPGSWHTKTERPRLCTIIQADDTREIDLQDAADKLEQLVGIVLAPNNGDKRGLNGFKTKTAWPPEALLRAAALLPNDSLSWSEWNRTLMVLYDAAHGGVDGLEAAHAFSEKSDKYDAAETDGRWDHFHASPPTDLSDRSLLYRLRKIDPSFSDPCAALPEKHFEDEDGVDEAVGRHNALARAATENWPEPIDIFGDESPLELSTPPAGSLPGIIDRWASSEARRKGVSPAFAAASAITVCAAAIGSSLTIRPRLHDDGWTEPAGLWTVLVADPGRAKSPTISAAVKPLRDLDAKRDQTNKPLHDAWLMRARKKGAGAPDPGPEPRAKRSLVDDTTLEEQVRLHAANPRGLLRAPDEFIVMLAALGAYKNGPDGDRGQMLRMFDGGELIIDRVKSGSTRATCALMSVIAGTQPEKIGKLARDLSGDGLLQRLLFIVDDGAQRRGVDEAPDRAAANEYHNMVRALAEFIYLAPKSICLSPAAYETITKAAEQIEALAAIPGASTAWKGHVQKWGKLLPRIVLVFHAIEQWSLLETIDPELTVDPATARKAVLFARFLLRHSLRFYETYFGSSDDISEARWIAGHLLVKPGLVEVTRRDLCRARPSLAKDRRGLLSAMGELESVAWATVDERDADGPKRWKVNPKIHVRFVERAEREKTERAQRRDQIQRAGEIRKTWLSSDNLSDDAGRDQE